MDSRERVCGQLARPQPVHSFREFSLNTYYIPGTVPSVGIVWNRGDREKGADLEMSVRKLGRRVRKQIGVIPRLSPGCPTQGWRRHSLKWARNGIGLGGRQRVGLGQVKCGLSRGPAEKSPRLNLHLRHDNVRPARRGCQVSSLPSTFPGLCFFPQWSPLVVGVREGTPGAAGVCAGGLGKPVGDGMGGEGKAGVAEESGGGGGTSTLAAGLQRDAKGRGTDASSSLSFLPVKWD